MGPASPSLEMAPARMMRFTLVEDRRGISFVAPPTSLAELVAGCARNPASINGLLDSVARHHAELVTYVRAGLAVFDEHNAYGNFTHIHAALQRPAPDGTPVFRVVDEFTRAASLQP